jgi:hypothetical protein
LTKIFLLLLSLNAFALTEKDYVNQHCKGKIEYRLPDKTRIDCLTDTHAWEYDYSNKWAGDKRGRYPF